jgi:phosphoribosyl 1,2-cyclic phosphate phosphodiesterase
MKLTFLGTGTSHGVPVIGCECPVCASSNPKNKRNRCSLWVEDQGLSIIIDTATEFRLQAIAYGVTRVDAILFTHNHADHVMGLDDIRPFNERQGTVIPCYGDERTMEGLKRQFAYAFMETGPGGGKPEMSLNVVHGPFQIGHLTVEPVEVAHGERPIFGYRIGKAAYITDASYIPAASMEKLRGLDVLVVNALRFRPHLTHFSVQESLEVIERLKPRKAFLTHICHELEHDETNTALPDGVEVAYDGLEVHVDD